MKAAALIVVIALGVIAGARAECANACSGHGDCASKDQCNCYPNWRAADCSERTCPFGLSFIDTPQGDLNHDGSVADASGGVSVQWNVKNTWEQFPNAASTQYIATTDEAHFYVECSNKGHCDRESGLCMCFDGYTGSSCQRTTCPNDCSGHGVCRTTGEIAMGAYNYHIDRKDADHTRDSGVGMSFTYNLWDNNKNQACWCDAGYTGADCSLRECPRGDDPLSALNKDCGGEACRSETQVLSFNINGVGQSGTGPLQFTDWTGKVWETSDITIESADADADATTLASSIQAALRAIPNDVVGGTTTVSGSRSSEDYSITVTFMSNDSAGDGNPGNLAALSLGMTTFDAADLTFTVTQTDGNTEEVECSYRGLCDYETGLCKCFKGYYLDDCSAQSTLAL